MKNFNVFSHQLGDAYRGVVSMFSPVATESKFESTGTLTPEEFVQAGDQLVLKFPTWQWASATSKSLEKSYLPKNKQYLITKGVPCPSRVRDLDAVLASTTREDKEDGWLVAGLTEDQQQPAERSSVPLTVDPPTATPAVAAPEVKSSSSTTQHVSQFDQLDKMLLEESEADHSTVHPTLSQPGSRHRSYDLSITWDKYYQTPRLWLQGYSDSGKSLLDEEVYQDVLSEYVTKTVTVEAHPATGLRTASIHPCQHARMMLQVINEWKAKGHPVRADLCLFVFLKFISGVVPTINYDFTMDIDM